jgi:hypothetical protein
MHDTVNNAQYTSHKYWNYHMQCMEENRMPTEMIDERKYAGVSTI